MSNIYHKIDGPFKRNPDNIKEVIPGQWRNETVAMLADSPIWVATEKIDGTNIRIIWDGHRVTFGGRTERADIPKHLLAALEEAWHAPGVEELFEETFGEKSAIIFGEGYGPKIQGGGKYRDTPGFIAFDVMVGETYLAQSDAKEIVSKFGAEFVPERWVTTLNDAARAVARGLDSWFGNFEPEGLVARTVMPLYDQRGNRLIVKLKAVDLKGMKI